jgi:RNA exonuclease 4
MSSDLKRKPKKKITPKPVQLNPNWSLLQQKLKSDSHGNTRKSSNPENPSSILGKRKERPDSEVDVPKINPLAPVNDDSSLTDEVAMDCEMVGVSQGTKSALGRVTLVNKWGNVLYDEFVRPVEHVVDFRTSISGIRPRDLRKAKDFRVAQTKVAELIKGKILVGHALHNDLKVCRFHESRIWLQYQFRVLTEINFVTGFAANSPEKGHKGHRRISALSQVFTL